MPGDLRPCCKQRAVWRAVNDALSPSSIAFFGHTGQLCICFACVCQNLRPTSGDRANPTQPISSPSAAAPGFHRLLFYLAGLSVLIVTVFTCRRLTRSFQNVFPTDLNTSRMPASVPLACSLSPCRPTACTNLRPACAFHITAKQNNLPTSPPEDSAHVHTQSSWKILVHTASVPILLFYVHARCRSGFQVAGRFGGMLR